MDCIRIINLKIPGRHGVYEFEKEKDGLFELDVELFLILKAQESLMIYLKPLTMMRQ